MCGSLSACFSFSGWMSASLCVSLSVCLCLCMCVFNVDSLREYSGGLVVRIPGFHCCGLAPFPGWWIEILQATWCGQKHIPIETSGQGGSPEGSAPHAPAQSWERGIWAWFTQPPGPRAAIRGSILTSPLLQLLRSGATNSGCLSLMERRPHPTRWGCTPHKGLWAGISEEQPGSGDIITVHSNSLSTQIASGTPAVRSEQREKQTPLQYGSQHTQCPCWQELMAQQLSKSTPNQRKRFKD